MPLDEARPRLAELVDEVRRTGEPIMLTDASGTGVEIAARPADPPGSGRPIEEVLDEIREVNADLPPITMEEILELIREGRDNTSGARFVRAMEERRARAGESDE